MDLQKVNFDSNDDNVISSSGVGTMKKSHSVKVKIEFLFKYKNHTKTIKSNYIFGGLTFIIFKTKLTFIAIE